MLLNRVPNVHHGQPASKCYRILKHSPHPVKREIQYSLEYGMCTEKDKQRPEL
jgi:hypothetical protein